MDITVPNGQAIDPKADLYIFVTSMSNPEEDFLTWGTMCDIDRGSFRPNIA